jgi:hypothetical protein
MARWLAAVMLLVVLTTPALADPVLRWSPADGAVDVGDQITLSVMLDDVLTVRTIELYIHYDPDLITTVSGGPGALFAGFTLFQGFGEVDPDEPGTWHGYCVILGAGAWTSGPGELYRWTVRGDLAGICAITTGEITLLPPGGGSYPGATLPATTLAIEDDLTATPPVVPAGATVMVQPNPFNPGTRVAFDLGTPQDGRLEVLDVRGRLVTTLWSGEAASGWASWNGTDLTGRAVPSGVYSFVLWGDDGRRTLVHGTLVR